MQNFVTCQSCIGPHSSQQARKEYFFVLVGTKLRSRAEKAPVETVVARIAITYKPKLFETLANNPFAGATTPEIDKAWGALSASMNIGLSYAELESNGQTSVALPEGGNYLAGREVFHELHCTASAYSQKSVTTHR